jgi:septum formation protein
LPVPVILASTSPFRAAVLRNAGVAFETQDPAIDESVLKARLAGSPPEAVARALAEAKALAVSSRWPDPLVIGSDQVLAQGRAVFDKPPDLEAARAQLLCLRGGEHRLLTAVCVARGGTIRWCHLDQARLLVRPFSEAFLDRYLQAVGPAVCRSVGGYQVEGLGAQLFSRIEGDHFAILGLPLLPLLGHLREHGALET